MLSLIALIQTIASAPPVAPTIWPCIDFVDETFKFLLTERSPKTFAIAFDSAISPRCVDVPWALT